MSLAIDTMDRSQSVRELENTVISSLMTAVQLLPEIDRLQGHESTVNSIAFRPDGKCIVSDSKNQTKGQWNVFPDGWLRIICNQLRYHPLLNRPENVITFQDPAFIRVAHRVKAACQ